MISQLGGGGAQRELYPQRSEPFPSWGGPLRSSGVLQERDEELLGKLGGLLSLSAWLPVHKKKKKLLHSKL